MNLVDMKNVGSNAGEIACATPDYPYGLKLYLNDAILDKLGIEDLPALGAEMTITAKVRVTAVSSREAGDDADQNMELQITAMSLDGKKDPGKLVKEMYGA